MQEKDFILQEKFIYLIIQMNLQLFSLLITIYFSMLSVIY